MRRTVIALLVCALSGALIATPMSAADPVEEVRQSEIAFAKAFADRDEAKFFSFVAEDAHFLGALSKLSGKKAITDTWTRFFKLPAPPFSWGPERVVVTADGMIALSHGPLFDPNGVHIANFASVWRKQADGQWKVIFDGPGSAAASLPETAAKFEEGDIKTEDGATLHYRKIGDGPLTMIVPLGFVMYDDFKQFADVATVIAYDLRDRGRSSRAENVNMLSIRQDVKDLEAVRAHFKVERFIPVGYSYLGLMTAMYALEYPKHVSRMIQLGPVQMDASAQFPANLKHGRDDMAVPEAAMKKYTDANASGMREKSPREYCEVEAPIMAHLLVGDPKNAGRIKSHCDLENEWPVNLARHGQPLFASIQNLGIAKDEFKKVTMPVLTIHGTKDRNAPYGSGRDWARTLPNARLVTVQGAAHQSWADDPVVVFGSIREFIRGGWPLGAEKVTQ